MIRILCVQLNLLNVSTSIFVCKALLFFLHLFSSAKHCITLIISSWFILFIVHSEGPDLVVPFVTQQRQSLPDSGSSSQVSEHLPTAIAVRGAKMFHSNVVVMHFKRLSNGGKIVPNSISEEDENCTTMSFESPEGNVNYSHGQCT